jgi:replication factor A3
METGMDCSEPTPRVNYELMQRYVGRKVRLVCKVEEFAGDTLKASSCDGQTVFIKPKQGSNYDTAFVEIEGIVENGTTVQEESFTSFGDSFDMNNYNELCKLANGAAQDMFL